MNSGGRLASQPELVGRSNEVQLLQDAFERISEDKKHSVFVTIAGHSGTGKSRLVDSFWKSTAIRRTTKKKKLLFCKGKCEAYRMDQPYWVLNDALRNLIRSMEKEVGVVDEFSKRIHDSIGSDDETLLTEIVPELSVLVGGRRGRDSAAMNEWTKGNLNFDRIKSLFTGLIGTISKATPLTIFLDDLQWIDASSLEIMSSWATDPTVQSLLLIVSYRNNEVNDDHPIKKHFQTIRHRKHDKSEVLHLCLNNLSQEQVDELVAKMLRLDVPETLSLSAVVYEKTHGNPFFVLQLMQALEREKLMNYSLTGMKWTWVDVERIRYNTDLLGDNVVNLIVNKLKQLPVQVQRCLMVASCLSSTIHLTMLRKVLHGLDDTDHDLDTICELASKEDLLLKDDRDDIIHYRFAHDRIQQASYSLTPEGPEQEKLHFAIGTVLINSRHSFDKADQSLVDFIAPKQLQLGKACMKERSEFVRLASLHCDAGLKAVSMTAFVPASKHFSHGIEIMNKDVSEAWENHHYLQMSLHQNLAEVSWRSGSPNRSEELVQQLLPHAKSQQEKLRAYYTLAESLGAQSRHEEALAVGVEQMKSLGFLPGSFHMVRGLALLFKLRKTLQKLSLEEVMELPLCNDPIVNYAQEYLIMIAKHAYFKGDKALHMYTCCSMARVVLDHGVHKQVLACFATVGLFVNYVFGDVQEGCRLGKMTLGMMEKWQYSDTMGLLVTWVTLNPWIQPLNETLQPLLDAFKSGMKQGHIEPACAAFTTYLFHGFLSGLSLDPLLSDARSHANIINQHKNAAVLGMLLPLEQAMLNLAGRSEKPMVLTGAAMDEDTFDEQFPGNAIAKFYYCLCKMMVCYYFGDYERADEMLSAAKTVGQTRVFFSEVAQLAFFDVLIPLALAFEDNGRSFYKRRARKAIKDIRRVFSNRNRVINMSHRLLLVEAGYLAITASTKNDQVKVKKAYDEAIRQSSRCGFRPDAALANLHAGDYFLRKHNDTDWAGFYISRSVRLFEDWGAKGMANCLMSYYNEQVDLSLTGKLLSTNFHGRRRHSNCATSIITKRLSSGVSWDHQVYSFDPGSS